MIATSNTSGTTGDTQGANTGSSDYTDPVYMAATAMITVHYANDLKERAIWIHECRMFLFSRLGAVLTASGASVRYWRPGPVYVNGCRGRRPKRIGFYVGFCSESRGLHWDRKRSKNGA